MDTKKIDRQDAAIVIDELRKERDYYQQAYRELLERIEMGDIHVRKISPLSSQEIAQKVLNTTAKRLAMMAALFLYNPSVNELAQELNMSTSSIRVTLFRVGQTLGFGRSILKEPMMKKAFEEMNENEFQDKVGIPKNWWEQRDKYRDIVIRLGDNS